MIVEIGHFSLVLSLAFLLTQSVLWLWRKKDLAVVVSLGRCLTFLSFFLVTVAYLCLIWSFATSDYSVVVVAKHSHGVSPWFYKVAASWGHHEGSLLLWLWVLCGYGVVVAFSRRLSRIHVVNTLVVQGVIASGLCFLIAVFSNPFLRLAFPPFQGQGFNPLLQDLAILIHPPLLYVGYVGMTTLFSLAAGYLMSKGSLDEKWVLVTRPFLLFALIFLTLGITLGGWWSYYELGWGGFWAWDPVENASLLPLLVGIVLLHLFPLLERGKCRVFCWWLCALAFFLSMFGTFLVRSGLMISLHSFASASDRGLALLCFLVVSVGGTVILFFRSRRKASPHHREAEEAQEAGEQEKPLRQFPISRGVLLIYQALFLLSVVVIIVLALITPIITGLLGWASLSVGSPYFATVLWPLALAMIFLVTLVPLTSWKKTWTAPRRTRRLFVSVGLVAGCAGLALSITMGLPPSQALFWWIFLFPCSVVLLLLSLVTDAVQTRISNVARLIGHFGIILLALGVAGSLWRVDKHFISHEVLTVKNKTMRVQTMETLYGQNFHSIVAVIQVEGSGGSFVLRPEKRYYPLQQRFTREVAMRHTLLGDWYVSMGEQTPDGDYSIHVSFIPLIWCIWAGMACFCLGLCASLLRGSMRKRS